MCATAKKQRAENPPGTVRLWGLSDRRAPLGHSQFLLTRRLTSRPSLLCPTPEHTVRALAAAGPRISSSAHPEATAEAASSSPSAVTQQHPQAPAAPLPPLCSEHLGSFHRVCSFHRPSPAIICPQFINTREAKTKALAVNSALPRQSTQCSKGPSAYITSHRERTSQDSGSRGARRVGTRTTPPSLRESTQTRRAREPTGAGSGSITLFPTGAASSSTQTQSHQLSPHSPRQCQPTLTPHHEVSPRNPRERSR